MGAKEIIDALNKIEFDRAKFLKAVLDYAVDRGLQEIDINAVTDKLIYMADEKGLIRPWMDELITIIGPDNAHDLLLNAIKEEVEAWLKDNDLGEMVDDWLNDDEEPPAPPPPSPPDLLTVRVQGNKIVSPAGNELFLKIATWENPFEGRVSPVTILNFMDFMQSVNLNCILLKGNMWLVHDNRSKHQQNVDTMHHLIREAHERGIYVILNLFDVWSRGKGGNQYNTNSHTHPINVWDWNHRFHAADFIKWVTREFKNHPRLLFELGNEMENKHNQSEVLAFKRVAKEHILPHFYNIAGKNRPIMVSQTPLWELPVNVLANHNPHSINKPGSRSIMTNELAYATEYWKDSWIRDAGKSNDYIMFFTNAKSVGQSGVAAATILDINVPLNGPAKHVLTELGKY